MHSISELVQLSKGQGWLFFCLTSKSVIACLIRVPCFSRRRVSKHSELWPTARSRHVRFTPIADIRQRIEHVRLVPEPDIAAMAYIADGVGEVLRRTREQHLGIS